MKSNQQLGYLVCKDLCIEGHKFEPRYDLGVAVLPDDIFQIELLSKFSSVDLDKFRKKTYVKDICVVCGQTQER